MGTKGPYPKEVRERAVKMVYDHIDEYPSKWAAICSIAEKLPMTAETLRDWVARAEIEHREVRGLTTDEKTRLRALEREVRELRRANEILKAASAFFARELD